MLIRRKSSTYKTLAVNPLNRWKGHFRYCYLNGLSSRFWCFQTTELLQMRWVKTFWNFLIRNPPSSKCAYGSAHWITINGFGMIHVWRNWLCKTVANKSIVKGPWQHIEDALYIIPRARQYYYCMRIGALKTYNSIKSFSLSRIVCIGFF